MLCDFVVIESKVIPESLNMMGFSLYRNTKQDCIEIKADIAQGAKMFVGREFIDFQNGSRCLWKMNVKYLISAKRIEREYQKDIEDYEEQPE